MQTPEDPLQPLGHAFAEPWHAQVLANAQALIRAGRISAGDWAEALGAAPGDRSVDLHASDFDLDQNAPRACHTAEDQGRDRVPGTGRVQTVSREANSRFHGLISAFGELTGVPMVLNTSFNENEPVVCTPEDAVACFTKTGMDVLVLEIGLGYQMWF